LYQVALRSVALCPRLPRSILRYNLQYLVIWPSKTQYIITILISLLHLCWEGHRSLWFGDSLSPLASWSLWEPSGASQMPPRYLPEASQMLPRYLPDASLNDSFSMIPLPMIPRHWLPLHDSSIWFRKKLCLGFRAGVMNPLYHFIGNN
jgi:hypothetical protein